jgi:hypothetical protein
LLQTLCIKIADDNSVDEFPYCGITLGPPVTTDGCYPEVAATSRSSSHLQQTPSPYPPDPPLLLYKAQLSPGASNDFAQPKFDKVTVVIVPVLLTIFLIAIGVCVIFWKRLKRLEQERRPASVDFGGRHY